MSRGAVGEFEGAGALGCALGCAATGAVSGESESGVEARSSRSSRCC